MPVYRRDQSSGSVTKKSVKGIPGPVFGIIATNTGTSLRWLQLHDKATAPSAGNIPILWAPIPAGTAANPGVVVVSSSWFGPNEQCALGIGWAISSTPDTFTDAAVAAEHTVQLRYS